MKRIQVVAAIVIHDERILCVQRGQNKYEYISQKYEFPGGKIPLPMVKGATTNAYPPSVSILGENMAGNSTPEPATVMGMFVVGAAGLVALWFIRRKNRMKGISI